MREGDEAVDVSSDGRIDEPSPNPATEDARAASLNPAALFADGTTDPIVVEASVEALFESFEEDTPEEVMAAAEPSVPEPGDVVGFDEAPDPRSTDRARDSGSDPGPGGPSSPSAHERCDDRTSRTRPVATADSPPPERRADGDGAFEWVSNPVPRETVLSDPETVLSDPETVGAAADTGPDDDRSVDESSVLDRVRSALPF